MLLAFVLLVAAFRAPVIALKAGVLTVLSIGASYGVVARVAALIMVSVFGEIPDVEALLLPLLVRRGTRRRRLKKLLHRAGQE